MSRPVISRFINVKNRDEKDGVVVTGFKNERRKILDRRPNL